MEFQIKLDVTRIFLPSDLLWQLSSLSFPTAVILFVSTKVLVPLDKGNQGSGYEIEFSLVYHACVTLLKSFLVFI